MENVVDGGAYHGSITKRLASLFPTATIHAFEPQDSTFKQLVENLSRTSRVSLNQAAISSSSGSAVLHVNQKAFTTSLLATLEPEEMISEGVQKTDVLTLDDWAAKQGIQSVQFIKLDLQGNELAALQGAERLLDGGVDVILTEVNFVRRYDGTCLFHDLASFLDSKGFRLYRLYELITDSVGAWKQGDALFVHSRVC